MPCAAASSVRRAGSGGTGSGSRRSVAGSPAAATNWSNPPGDTIMMAGRAGRRYLEAVRDPARQEHQRAGPGLPRPVPAEPLDFAVQDEERLIACLVDVRRRREAGRHPVVDDAEPALSVGGADLVDGQGVQEPERRSLVGRDGEPVLRRRAVRIHCRLRLSRGPSPAAAA